jgi:hypothetical protein
MDKTLKFWIISIFYTTVFIVVYGYQFNGGDQEEHLPQVYKLLQPELYKNDYVVNNLLSNFSVRFFFTYLIYALSTIVPIGILCFTLYFGLLSAYCFFLVRLVDLFFQSEKAVLIAPAICMVIVNKFTVGGNYISDSLLTCSVFANTFCISALYYFFSGKKNLAHALLGIASLFQLLMGLHVFLLLIGLQIVEYFIIGNKLQLIKSTLIYLLVSSPMLAPILFRQFLNTDQDSGLYFYILYVIRGPHHYIPSFFLFGDYVKSIGLILVSMIGIIGLPPTIKKRIVIFMCLIIAGMIFYFLAVEVFKIYALGLLQWFKTSVWLTLFCGIALSGYIAKQKYLSSLFFSKKIKYISIVVSIVSITIVLNSKIIPFEKLGDKYKVANYSKSDLTLMHEWISQNTDIESLIISFPRDETFLCEAKRPTPVAWKAIIHEPWFMIEWYKNFINYYHLKDEIKWEKKDFKSLAEKNYNEFNNNIFLKSKNIVYRLDNFKNSKIQNTLGTIIHKQGTYVLTRIE